MSKLSLLFSLFLSVSIFACKCETLSLEKSFENADIVFTGNIYSIKQTPSGFKTLQNFISSIKIEKVFKSGEFSGFYQDEATLLSSQIQSCDYMFNRKGKFLIFGYIDSDTGFIYSDICFSTAELDIFSSDELKQLDKLSENFKRESEIKNNESEYVKEKSLIEDSPDHIINDLNLKINILESENKNLKIIILLLGSIFLLVIILLVVKVNIRLKGKSARKFF